MRKKVSELGLVRHYGQKDHEQISGNSYEQEITGTQLSPFLARKRICRIRLNPFCFGSSSIHMSRWVPSRADFLIVVDFVVRPLDNHGNSNFECIANPQKCRHCNRTTSFNLLPMASGESKSNHILLAVAAFLAKVLDPLAKGFEESGVVYHAATFTFA